ncbi:DUF998 domain-containing protein [Marinactinospora rubrisoli]|uniref:DUF998 domain-containing protein n=1 Tax=Marinactinospora rubrisoli TaxID=2715399 RepID=A0ABW2KB54_9ACTN
MREVTPTWPERAQAAALGRFASSALILAVVAILVVHADGEMDPVNQVVSSFAFSRYGVLVGPAIAALSVASAAAFAALRVRYGPLGGLTWTLAGVWCAGLLVAALVPTDPLGHGGLSVGGEIHRWATLGSFCCLPVASWHLAPRLSAVNPAAPAGALRRLALASLLMLGVMLVITLYCQRTGIGMAQRIMLVTEVGIIAVLLRSAAAGPPPARPPAGRGAVAPQALRSAARSSRATCRNHSRPSTGSTSGMNR